MGAQNVKKGATPPENLPRVGCVLRGGIVLLPCGPTRWCPTGTQGPSDLASMVAIRDLSCTPTPRVSRSAQLSSKHWRPPVFSLEHSTTSFTPKWILVPPLVLNSCSNDSYMSPTLGTRRRCRQERRTIFHLDANWPALGPMLHFGPD